MSGIGALPALNLSVEQTKGQIQGANQEQGRSISLLDLGQKCLDPALFQYFLLIVGLHKPQVHNNSQRQSLMALRHHKTVAPYKTGRSWVVWSSG